jgi:hypothetical protein
MPAINPRFTSYSSESAAPRSARRPRRGLDFGHRTRVLASMAILALTLAACSAAPVAPLSGADDTAGSAPRATGLIAQAVPAKADAPAASRVRHFRSQGSVLAFDDRGYLMTDGRYSLRINFEGARADAGPRGSGDSAEAAVADGAIFPLERVDYEGVWPGIDATYDAPEGKVLRSTWRIEAGVDPAAIRLRYNRPVALDASGELKVRFAAGTLTESAPLAWQDVDGSRAPVEVAFRRIDDSLIGFEVGAYRSDLPLVIDPSVDFEAGNGFLSFAGTLFVPDNGRDLLVVADGTGDTISSTLFGGYAGYSQHAQYIEARDNDRLRMNVASVVNNGGRGSDLVVSRQDEFGNLEWMTVIGNRYSGSTSAPLNTLGAYTHETILHQPSKPKRHGNGMHLTAGGRLFLVGSSEAEWEGLKCAPGGCGADESNTLAIDPPLTPHTGDGNHDIWLAEFDPATGDLLWHTFIQGPAGDQFVSDFDIDGNGNFWITGSSTSDFNLPGDQEPVHQFWTDWNCDSAGNGCWRDGTYVTSETPGGVSIVGIYGAPMVIKVDPNGTPLLHTFYGGHNGSQGNVAQNNGTFRAIHFDPGTGDVFVTGAGGGIDNLCDDATLGSNPFDAVQDKCVFPEDRSNGNPRRLPTGTRYDTATQSNHDIVFMRLDGNTLDLACSTYLGGWGVDQPTEIFDLADGGLTILGTSSNEWTEPDGSTLAGVTIVKPFAGTAVQCQSTTGAYCTTGDRPDLVDQRDNGHEPFLVRVDRDCYVQQLGFPSEEAGNESLGVYSAIYSTSKGKLFLAGETGAPVGGSKSPFSGGTDGLLMEVDPATYSATGLIYAGGSSNYRTYNGNQDWITAIAEAGTEEFFINGTSKARWETDTDAYLFVSHSGSFYTNSQAAEASKDGFGARVSAPGAYCGDGNIDVALGEACDDGGESATCNADCTTSVCGDGVANASAGEACDDGGVETATCNPDCTAPTCGDGYINATAGETCEEATSPTLSATCDSDCTAPVCGDGVVNPATGEDCDDAGESASCDADCTFVVCGDGVVNTVVEDCEEGGVETATCNPDCSTPTCGDGYINATSGEVCDDSGESASCNANCSNSVCGDGITNTTAGEQCDDSGESVGCNANCSNSVCGDGIINTTAGEVCDDSGESASCNANCSNSVCGDGITNTTSGEQCDDAGPSSGCTASCELIFTISGRVFDDADASQVFAGGESGIDGVTVVLYDVAADSCQSVATAGGGLYSFGDLRTKDYRVYETAGETAGALTECPPTESTTDFANKTVIPGTIADPPTYMSTTPNRIDLSLTADAPDQNFGDHVLGAALACEQTAYLFEQDPSQIVGINLVTGGATNTGLTLGTYVNGFGYSVLDGLFWGNDVTASGQAGTPETLSVVAADGSDIALPCENCAASTDSYDAGDVNLDGYLLQWSSGGANTGEICWYDVNPQRATYLQRVDSATGQASTGCVSMPETLAADGAVNPLDGLIYAARSASGDLYQWDPSSGANHTYTSVVPTPCSGGYGAQFFDAEGYLYVSCDATGEITRLDVRNPPAIGAPHDFEGVLFSSGPVSTLSDGGRCAMAITELDLGDVPDTYGTSIENDGPRHGYTPGWNIHFGTEIDTEEDGQPTPDASGEDTDDDGPLDQPEWATMADSISMTVTVTNETGQTAHVKGWVDWNENGTFDSGDEEASATTDVTADVTLTWTTPAGQVNNPPFARLRVSTDPAAIATPLGPAADGEVEDHQLSFAPMPTCSDGLLNLDETNVDCGGSCPDICITYGMHPDVSRMKFARGTSGLDYVLVQGGLDPIAWDPATCEFELSISNTNGPVVSFAIPAGSLTDRGRCSKYKDAKARRNGGMQKLQVCQMQDPGKVRFNLKGFEDFDAAATLADMSIDVTACGNTYSRLTTWRPLKRGWLLPRTTWEP